MTNRGSRTEYWPRMELDSSDQIVHDTQGETPSAPLIHIESSDDEVILSSPRSFADAKLNSRKRRVVPVPVVDVDSGNTEDHLPNLAFRCTRRRSALASETVINSGQYINLESSSNSVNGNAGNPAELSTALTLPTLPQEQSMVLPSPTPPSGIIFSCPICMNPCIELNCIELMSTLRGHVFCESCIKVMDSSETLIYFDHNINLQSRWNYGNGYSENLLEQSTVMPSPTPPPEQSTVMPSPTPPPGQSTVMPSPTPPPEQSTVWPSPTPPPEPIFSCPICMNAFVESMSTKCGHVFCKSCITRAISVQKKCPTCRQKLTTRGIHRVYLPTSSN